jgi:hypothetical protein
MTANSLYASASATMTVSDFGRLSRRITLTMLAVVACCANAAVAQEQAYRDIPTTFAGFDAREVAMLHPVLPLHAGFSRACARDTRGAPEAPNR